MQEYLSVWFMTKDLTLSQLYDAINDVYKAQLKVFHQFGKDVQNFIKSHHTTLCQEIKKVGWNADQFPTITAVD